LGRARNISDYIKNGRQKAIIEIELLLHLLSYLIFTRFINQYFFEKRNNKNGNNFLIKRIIYKDNRNDWFLNERQIKLKDIEELVAELNIQVANLCQFLPQEKVSEFARMNAQELLENTEKAVKN